MRRCSLLIAALTSLLLLAPHPARAAQQSSLDQYRSHIQSLRALVQSCQAKAAMCDPGAIGSDEQVRLPGLGAGANTDTFGAHYDWLRQILHSARDPNQKSRAAQLQSAESRLDADLREVAGTRPASTEIAVARKNADAILARQEFAMVRNESLTQRLGARVGMVLDRFFDHIAQFGKRSPWIGPAIEWGCIGLALLVLVVWAMRALQRQRLAVRVEAERRIGPWQEAARSWRALADERAAQGDWREAVHCMYWATIAMLEARRLWAPNRSRTPREYLRLVEDGSERWNLLRQQTRGFEHIWYGQHEALQRDFQQAVELHEGLRV